MEVDFWNKSYINSEMELKWPCPNCDQYSLNVRYLDFSIPPKDQPIWNERNIEKSKLIHFNFLGSLLCETCRRYVYFTGIADLNSYENDDLSIAPQNWTPRTFTPTYFEPSIKLFNPPIRCPNSVRDAIENSFRFFWCDLQSCANKIRISLELLMNELKIAKYKIKNSKQVPISLHKRIELVKNEEVRDILLAIKWIGNTGSHLGKLEKINILEIYKLLDTALIKLYDNKESEIKKIVKEINKRKGVRKR